MSTLWTTIIKIVIVFTIITVYSRVSSSRRVASNLPTNEVGQIILGAMAGSVMLNPDISIVITAVGITVCCFILLAIQMVKLKSPKARTLLDGHAVELVAGGVLNTKAFNAKGIQYSYIHSLLLERGVSDISEVENLWLNSDGSLTIDLHKDVEENYHTLIDSGKIHETGFAEIKKDQEWLSKRLEDNGVSIDDVFLAQARGDELLVVGMDGKIIPINK